jgi:integrase
MASARVVLTRAMIERAACPPGKTQDLLRDAVVPGLVVRVLPGGSKTYYFVYRPAGSKRGTPEIWLKLGSFSAVRLADARTAARGFAGDVAKGHDPGAERREAKRKEKATLAVLFADGGAYEASLKARGLVNVRTAMSSLRRGLKAHMATDVAALTRADVVAAVTELVRLGLSGAAGDLRKFANGFLAWSVEQGLVQFNVLAGLRLAGRTRAQRLKDGEESGQALTDDEIVKLWRACEELQARAMGGRSVSGSFAGLAQLALLTGMRRGELAQLRHDHIVTHADDRDGISGLRIRLPEHITKTGRAHNVPLTPMMRTVIDKQVRTTSPLVFPSSHTDGPMSGWSQLVPKLRDLSGVSFALHDLRRTVRTTMSKLGVSEDIAELSIGHARADLIARYNKDQAWPARVEAFERVSAHISALLAQAADERGNVVPMHGAGRMQAT